MRYFLLTLLLSFVVVDFCNAQDQVPYNDDNTVDLYAQTKQINQFIRRFNGEEDARGKRYYSDDKQFRNPKLREKYLNILFDLENVGITQNDKVLFKNTVINESEPKYLQLKDEDWWAEVEIMFLYNYRPCNGKIYLEIEEENDGLKWSIRSVDIPDIMDNHGSTPPDSTIEFLHPLSHELDFMNLERVFENPQYIDQFLVDDYKKDPLSIFTEAIRSGDLKFKTVRNVKFHMYQIENWYFTIQEFNRSGYNKGYLISNLQQLQESKKQEQIANMLNGEI